MQENLKKEKLDLCKIRDEIDKVDTELAKLFEKRMEIVLDVIQYKKENNLPVKDENREEKILEKCEDRVSNPRYINGLKKLMRSLMDITCEIESEILDK